MPNSPDILSANRAAFVRDTITDDDGSTKERIFHKEYLMFVYPGGDSILTTQGFKDSENIFKLKK